MSKHARCIWSVFFALLASMLLSQAVYASVLYRIGVLARREKDTCMLEWQETARYLSGKIKMCSFEIVPLDFNEEDINESDYDVTVNTGLDRSDDVEEINYDVSIVDFNVESDDN